MSKGIVETDHYLLFWGGWPSQWYKSNFTLGGVSYNCCEQYMMAEKARVFGDDETLSHILAATNPSKQKALGRQVSGFDPAMWNSVCRGIVYTGNLARFTQEETFRRTLLETADKMIVEASPVDSIWGIGLAPHDPAALDPDNWRGTNWLGIALMQVRDSLNAKKSKDAELIAQLGRRPQQKV